MNTTTTTETHQKPVPRMTRMTRADRERYKAKIVTLLAEGELNNLEIIKSLSLNTSTYYSMKRELTNEGLIAGDKPTDVANQFNNTVQEYNKQKQLLDNIREALRSLPECKARIEEFIHEKAQRDLESERQEQLDAINERYNRLAKEASTL